MPSLTDASLTPVDSATAELKGMSMASPGMLVWHHGGGKSCCYVHTQYLNADRLMQAMCGVSPVKH